MLKTFFGNMKKEIYIESHALAFAFVPEGSFLAGSSVQQIEHVFGEVKHLGIKKEWLYKEFPQHSVKTQDFWIGIFQVTNSFRNLIVGTSGSHSDNDNLPAIFPKMEDVDLFLWELNTRTGSSFRLPSEYEWEKASRGTLGSLYPWGDEFSPNKCNTVEGGIGYLVDVDNFRDSASPFGLIQCSGNAEEWTSSKYHVYPGGSPVCDKFGGPNDYAVLKGGKFNSHLDLAHCARRHGLSERSVPGLRLVLDTIKDS